MMNSKWNIALYALVAMLAVAPAATFAASCGSEPSVSSASSFQTWRQWCSCMGGTSPSNLNDAQRQGGCRLPSGSGSSSAASGDSIGTIIGNALGQAISDALFGNPEQEARRKAQEALRAEQQRRAAEELNRKQEAQKNRLLGGMMGVDNSAPLGLMDIETGPELGLMTDSASAVTRPAEAPPPAAKHSDSFTKGFEHASQCFSQNSGSACAGVTADRQATCVADYRGGYDAGLIQQKLVLEESRQAGTDAAARGELANAGADPRALGPCRNDWILAYNRGYGPRPASRSELAMAGAEKPGPDNQSLEEFLRNADRDPLKHQDPAAFIKKVTPGYLELLGMSEPDRKAVAALMKDVYSYETGVPRHNVRALYESSMEMSADSYADLAAAARKGQGRDLIAAGYQSGNDCAVFALANAANLPYGVAATRTTNLLETAPWRSPEERKNPASALASGAGKGLNGVEVAILAQSFGDARAVDATKIAAELVAGRAVTTTIDVPGGRSVGSHQVAVTRIFQNAGATYYEVLDSNASPSKCPACRNSRTFWLKQELDAVMNSDGIVVTPKEGTVVKALR